MKPSRRPEVMRARYARLNSIVEPIDLSGIESLFEDLGIEAERVVRPATQAASQVLYDAVKSNVAAIPRVSGNLALAIYQAYSQENSGPTRATYHLSWNAKTAPHGGLVEYGYWQRYSYRPDGMGPMVRAGMEGRRKPGRHASRSEKEAYYVPRPGGPVYVPGKAFMRRAISSFGAAAEASAAVLFEALEKVK